MRLPIERAVHLAEKLAARFLLLNRDGTSRTTGHIDGAMAPKDMHDWLATYKSKAEQSKALAAIPIQPTSPKGLEFFHHIRRGLAHSHGQGKDRDSTKIGATMPIKPTVPAPVKPAGTPPTGQPVGNVQNPPLARVPGFTQPRL